LSATDRETPGAATDRSAIFQSRMREAVDDAEARMEKQQGERGKLGARKRLSLFLDEGSFQEIGALARHRATLFGLEDNRPYTDGVITGIGTVEGRTVCVFAQDFTVFGGSLGEVHGEKICKLMDTALDIGCPIIGLNDGGGARIQEGVSSMAMYAEIFQRNVQASGVIPQISMIMGSCVGGAAYSPALTDFVVMVDKKSNMLLAGPDVIKAVTGEEIDVESLGGSRVHNNTSGNAHYNAPDEEAAMEWVRALLSYLPSNNLTDPPQLRVTSPAEPTGPDIALDNLISGSRKQPYDMYKVIDAIADDGDLLEIQEDYARNIICGFIRIDGNSAGVVASQPSHMGGCLDIAAAEKAARFVRMCDTFNIPIITFVDTPGFLPGIEQEWNGILRRGAKIIYAYAESTVPKLTVVLRKAYGGAYIVMGSKHLGADLNLAWPSAEIAVMGAEGAVEVLHRKKLATAPDPADLRRRLVQEYEDALLNPYTAAERGYVDAVIMPSETRLKLSAALRIFSTKRKSAIPRKHGNIPL
jgi:propionyl-CoA carboxylase beta chain